MGIVNLICTCQGKLVSCQPVKMSIRALYPWAGQPGVSKKTIPIIKKTLRVFLWNKCDNCLCINSAKRFCQDFLLRSRKGQFCSFSLVRTSHHVAPHPGNLALFRSSHWISESPYHEILIFFFVLNFLKLGQMDFCSYNQRVFTKTI